MSRLRIFADDQPHTPLMITSDHGAMARELAGIGVGFEQWQATQPVQPGDSQEVILAAYRNEIDRLVAARGFKSIDVASVAADHPQKHALRAKFLDEHYHEEDEVRFFVAGSGLFSLHVGSNVYEIRCEQGDLLAVPDSTLHWFDMGPEPSFVAIRFFTRPDGWVGHFTGNAIAQKFPRYEPGAAG